MTRGYNFQLNQISWFFIEEAKGKGVSGIYSMYWRQPEGLKMTAILSTGEVKTGQAQLSLK